MSRNPRRAFTLLEVLVTMALVLLVLGVAAEALIGTATSAPRTRLRAEEEAEILRVSGILRRQVLTVATSSLTDLAVTGGKDPQGVPELELVTSSPLYGDGVGVAQWRIVRNPGEAPYLGYRELPYAGGEKTGAPDPFVPFSRMVRDMKVEFWSSPDWVDSWKRSEVPERIRVTMTFLGYQGEDTFTVEAAPGIAGTSSAAGAAPGSTAPAPTPKASPSPAASPGPPLPPPPGAPEP